MRSPGCFHGAERGENEGRLFSLAVTRITLDREGGRPRRGKSLLPVSIGPFVHISGTLH